MNDIEWMEQRPESLKDAPYFKDAEDGVPRTVAQLASDVENAGKMLGNLGDSHIRIPPPDSAQEDIDKFRERVLKTDSTLTVKPEDYSPVPENAEGYKDPTIEGFSEDTAAAKALAISNKWSQAQYDGFVKQMALDHKAGIDGRTKWLTEQSGVLATALGTAKDDHIARTAAALKESHPEVSTALLDGSLDAKVALAVDSLVHQMLEMGGEAGEFNEQAGAGGRVSTPSEAAHKADEIRTEMMDVPSGSRRHVQLQAELIEQQRLSRPH